MTEAYAGQVRSEKRGIELVDRRAHHVRDQVPSPAGDVRWAMVTSAKITLDGEKALLEQDGNTLVVDLRDFANVAEESFCPSLASWPVEATVDLNR